MRYLYVLIETAQVWFDFDLVEKILKYSNVPVVVCSGAGTNEDVLNLVKNYDCDGVGIGSMFHYNYFNKNKQKIYVIRLKELRMGKQVILEISILLKMVMVVSLIFKLHHKY